MSKLSAKFISSGGKILAAIAAIVLLGKPHEAIAREGPSDNANSTELDSSSSTFEPIVMEDTDDKPPLPE